MHSYRSRIIFAIRAVLLSLGAAAVTLHSIYYNSKPDPVWEMHEDFNKALLDTGKHDPA